MSKTRPWNRLLWGVKLICPNATPMLIGKDWEHQFLHYDGEPTRALLFVTRKHARAWCRKKQATYKNRNDSCAKWKFTPVRVREIVTEL